MSFIQLGKRVAANVPVAPFSTARTPRRPSDRCPRIATTASGPDGCGITAADDRLPPRLLEPTTEGGQAGKVPDVAYQLEEYYNVRGWTTEGVPTVDKLKELNLEFASTGSR